MSLETEGGMIYIDRGKPKKSEKNLPHCPPQIPDRLKVFV
jgi:hypothetical protein